MKFIDDMSNLHTSFLKTQNYIKKGKIIIKHDVSQYVNVQARFNEAIMKQADCLHLLIINTLKFKRKRPESHYIQNKIKTKTPSPPTRK